MMQTTHNKLLDVTPDTQIPAMLYQFCQMTGEKFCVCKKCHEPYVTNQHYRNDELCIECSVARAGVDRERRLLQQRGYHAKRKEMANDNSVS